MAAWSTKRKFLYAALFVAIAAAGVALPAWRLLHTAPSCFDGIQNGDETGIDCGGSCTKVCQSAFLPLPSPSWVRFKEVAPNAYNVAAYVVNPNPKAGAKRIPYAFDFIDSQGLSLAKYTGVMDIAPGRNTLVFGGPVQVKDQRPARAVITIGDPAWYVGNDPLPSLAVVSKDYTEASSSSALAVTLKNAGALSVPAIYVYSVLYDASGAVVDFSRTLVDGIAPGGTAIAPFTWPYSHDGKAISIEVLSVPQ